MGRFSLQCQKMIRVCLGFALLRLVIGLKLSRHFLDQSEVKLKPIMTRTRTLPRASCRLCSFDCLLDCLSFVIGRSYCFGFGLRHSTKNRSIEIKYKLSLGIPKNEIVQTEHSKIPCTTQNSVYYTKFHLLNRLFCNEFKRNKKYQDFFMI